MANPSLQIGNSKWAIKKDNLLGYSTAGTRFLPIPITMTRASAGTRVNPQGLVETVELLGSEEIIDGGFPNGSNDWSEINGGTIINNEMVLDCGGNTNAYTFQSKATSYTSGKTYKLTVKVASNTTGVNLILYPFSNSLNTSVINIGETAGTYTIYFVADYTSGTGNTFALRALSSTGTLTIDNVSVKESTRNDLARVDYTGSTSSLLAEPQRTNLIPYSEGFNSWNTVQNLTVVEDTSETTSPSGNNTASKLTINSVSTPRRLFEVVTTSSGSDYTYTLYAKKGTTDFIRILLTSIIIDAEFNLTNGTVTSGTGIIQSVGNDWYRIQGTGTSSLTAEVPQIQLSDSASVNDYLYIWGGQVEEGSYGTSYIPTSGSTVTRVQDQYSKTGISDKINSEEGVLFIEAAALSDDGTNRYISISDGTASNYIYFRFLTTSNRVLSRIAVGGVTINGIQITITDTTAYNKYAIKWKSGDYAFWINGVEVGADTSSTIFGANTLNQLKFSFPTLNGGGFPSKVKQLQVFKTALTDSELATLTTI